MNNNITLLMKYILSELLKSGNYLFIFTLSKKIHMDIYSIESSIKQLTKQGYVERDAEDEFKVRITQNGSDWLLNYARFMVDREKEWRRPPEEFSQHQIRVDDYYVPITTKLDKQFLNKYGIQGGS